MVIYNVYKENLVYYDPTHIQGIWVRVVMLSLIFKAEIKKHNFAVSSFLKNKDTSVLGREFRCSPNS